MLCKVLARSLPANQLLANKELPKGLVFKRLARCGIEPALKRDSNAALLAGGPREPGVESPKDGEPPAVYGEAEGVCCPDFGSSEDCEPLRDDMPGNRDGTVPARVLRRDEDEELFGLPPVAWPASKSGKLSLPGDSGIVSRSGVECPLPVVGGPQICGERPSCCWISRALYQVSFMPNCTFGFGVLKYRRTALETGDCRIPWMESQLQRVQFLPGSCCFRGHFPADSGDLTRQAAQLASWPATHWPSATDSY